MPDSGTNGREVSSDVRSPTTVGLIGLGLIGSVIARKLQRAVWTLYGWDVNEEARLNFLSIIGTQVVDVPQMLDCCDTIVLSLPSDRVVAEVLSAHVDRLRPGQLILDTSTGSPRGTIELAARLEAKGIEYIDATISGSSVQLANGTAVLFIGARDQGLKRVENLLQTLAEKKFHVGGPGAGAQMKLISNLVLGLNRAALAEGLAYARAKGMDLPTTLHLLRESMAYSRIMDTKGEKMVESDFTPQARLSQHAKDVGLILEDAVRSGLQLPLSEAHDKLLKRATELGWGDSDNSAIIKAYEQAKSEPENLADQSSQSPGSR